MNRRTGARLLGIFVILALVFAVTPASTSAVGSLAGNIGNLIVRTLRATNNVQFNDTLTVLGVTTLADLDVTGDQTVTGDLNVTGAVTANGVITNTGNLTLNNLTAATAASVGVFKAAAPSGVTTATPAAYVNNGGATNDILVLAKAGTPVWKIGNSGAQTIVAGGQTITAGGQTITAGGQTITAGGQTITAGGQTITAGGQTITAGGQTITAGGETITAGGLTITAGGATIGGWVVLTTPAAVVVSAGSIITPTGTYQRLTSASSVTCNTTKCIEDGATSGQLLILRNANASDTITIDGTGANVECKTDKTLGAQDTLMLLWNGADWVCIAGPSDNS